MCELEFAPVLKESAETLAAHEASARSSAERGTMSTQEARRSRRHGPPKEKQDGLGILSYDLD